MSFLGIGHLTTVTDLFFMYFSCYVVVIALTLCSILVWSNYCCLFISVFPLGVYKYICLYSFDWLCLFWYYLSCLLCWLFKLLSLFFGVFFSVCLFPFLNYLRVRLSFILRSSWLLDPKLYLYIKKTMFCFVLRNVLLPTRSCFNDLLSRKCPRDPC